MGKECSTCKYYGTGCLGIVGDCVDYGKWEPIEAVPISCANCTHRFTDANKQGNVCSTCSITYKNWVYQEDVPETSDTDSTYVKKADLKKSDTELLNPFKTQVGGEHYQLPVDLAELLIRDKVGYAEGAVMKYVFRHVNKNGIEDLRKAKHYLEMIAFCMYNEDL